MRNGYRTYLSLVSCPLLKYYRSYHPQRSYQGVGKEEDVMNYAGIKYCDIANGTGCRTVLFVSGCRNACKGCFQPQTWDFGYGEPFDEKVQKEVLDSLAPDYITGITLLGGEPFEQENQKELVPFMRKVVAQYPNKNVWAFTGYIYDKDLLAGGRRHTEDTDELLSMIDVLLHESQYISDYI